MSFNENSRVKIPALLHLMKLGLQWLRTHQMEPSGFGKLIKKAKGKK